MSSKVGLSVLKSWPASLFTPLKSGKLPVNSLFFFLLDIRDSFSPTHISLFMSESLDFPFSPLHRTFLKIILFIVTLLLIKSAHSSFLVFVLRLVFQHA